MGAVMVAAEAVLAWSTVIILVEVAVAVLVK